MIDQGDTVEIFAKDDTESSFRWMGPAIVLRVWHEVDTAGKRSTSYDVQGLDFNFGLFYGRWYDDKVRTCYVPENGIKDLDAVFYKHWARKNGGYVN